MVSSMMPVEKQPEHDASQFLFSVGQHLIGVPQVYPRELQRGDEIITFPVVHEASYQAEERVDHMGRPRRELQKGRSQIQAR